MSNTDIKSLETYFFSENKEDFLKTLIAGTDQYYFFTLLHALNKHGSNLPEDAATALKQYESFKTQRAQGIKIKELLLQYDNATTTELKNSAIDQLNELVFQLRFNHTQPGNVSVSHLTDIDQKIRNNLDEKLIDIDYIIDERINEKNITQIIPSFISSEKVFASENLEMIIQYLNSVDLAQLENAPQLLKRYRDLYFKRHNQKTGLDKQYYNKLTLDQLTQLAEIEPDFNKDKEYLGELLRKKFRIDNLNDTTLGGINKEERRAKLLEIWQWSKNIHQEFYSLARQILYEILTLDIELNHYDKELFIEYLLHPVKLYQNAEAGITQSNQYISYDQYWHQVHNFQTNKWNSGNQLIENYLRHFFETATDIKPFDNYLNTKYLNKIFYEVKLLQGAQLSNITDLLTANQIEELKNSKEITILEHNKGHFVAGEQVKLIVAIKNISILIVKVFEINIESYYKKNFKTVDSNINLDGLRATEERVLEYNQPPIVRTIQEIKFDTITSKNSGIFVVELVGNGVSSRAIIKKGRLTLLNSITPAGTQFQILDENLEICKGNNTGIYTEGKFHSVNQDGKIVIPFVQSARTVKAILLHSEFAELVNLQLETEQIDFKCAFLYNSEQFLAGTKVKVVLQPRLYISNHPAPLELIKEPEVKVTTITDTGIPVSNVFDQIKLDMYKDIEVEFPVPAKLQQVKIEITGKVSNLQKKKQNISQTHDINFNLYQNIYQTSQLYLRFTRENGYEIYVLGKNGEPKKNVSISLQLTHSFYTQPISDTVQTNEQGKVILGHLNNISSVNASCFPTPEHPHVERSWTIQNKPFNYPTNLIICEKDKIVLPYQQTEISTQQIGFYEILNNQSSVVTNLTSSLKLNNNALIIENLQIGWYVLKFYNLRLQVKIQVVRGEYWKKSNLLATQEKLIEVSNQMSNLLINNIEIDEQTNSLHFQIFSDKNPQFTRAHVFIYSLLPPNVQQLSDTLQKVSIKPPEKQFTLQTTKNLYLSNKKLGDEYVYVLDRKNHTRYIGNTLERPQVLLKRTFVRETTSKKEELQADKAYDHAQFDLLDTFESKQQYQQYQQQQPYQAQYKMSSDRYPVGGFVGGPINIGEDSFINYLQNPAIVVANLKPNEQGIISIDNLNLSAYSSVEIVVSNLYTAVNRVVSLPQHKLPTKDLRYKQTRKENSFYSITRNTDILNKDNTITIQNFASTEFQIVDSLSKVFDLQKELRNSKGNDTENGEGYTFWSFLKNWNTLTYEEKNKKYDEFASHELNIFLYFHDQEFFNNFVRSFIINKIEKTFVDYFLLNDEKKLDQYSNVQNIEVLNVIEIILLLIYITPKDPNSAKSIVEYLENKNKLVHQDINTFKRYFDTVINARKSDDLQNEITSVSAVQNFVTQNIQPFVGGGFGMAQLSNINVAHMPRSVPQSYSMSLAAPISAPSYGIMRNEMANFCEDDMAYGDYMEEAVQTRNILEQREAYTAGFENLEATKEYAERNYFNQKERINTYLVNVINTFWVDYAHHILEKGVDAPFLSQNFIYATENHTEMIVALSVLSLPFVSGNHQYTTVQDRNLQIKVHDNVMVFQKQIKETQPDLRGDILIAQRFFDVFDRYEYTEGNEQIEKDVSEYIIERIYGCQAIVTNCTVARQQFQVLVEIPEGAVPVFTIDSTKSHTITLESFTTQTIEYYFYFPSSGIFKLLPANVSKDGKVLAVSKEKIFEVKETRTNINLDTMGSILTSGSKDDILQFIATKNLFKQETFNFYDLYWLLKDKDFFKKFTDILRNRKIYDYDTWSYSIYHKDSQTLQEFLSHHRNQETLSQYIKYLQASLVTIQKYRFYEYSPLVNPRVHQLNKNKSNILNNEFKKQYQQFLEYLIEVPTPTHSELLSLAYYLLLQDRINEAIKLFSSINKEALTAEDGHEGKLQYDYFAAYIDFYTGYPDFKVARAISEDYLDYPILSWRKLFIEISNQLAEYDGEEDVSIELKALQLAEEDEEEKKKNAGAATEEALTLELEGNKLILVYQNVERISVKYYEIDIEILFSRNPFFLQSEGDFGYVKPNYEEVLTVDKSHVLEKKIIQVAPEFVKKNVYIQVTTQNKTASTTYFSTNIKVQIIENYGQVKVTDSENKPLSKVYVKTFAKLKSGLNQFYKDGYTDLRGRFDYASLNAEELSVIDKFAIFVMSDEHGSLIKEAKTPSTLGRIDTSLVLKSKKAQAIQSQQRKKWCK